MPDAALIVNRYRSGNHSSRVRQCTPPLHDYQLLRLIPRRQAACPQLILITGESKGAAMLILIWRLQSSIKCSSTCASYPFESLELKCPLKMTRYGPSNANVWPLGLCPAWWSPHKLTLRVKNASGLWTASTLVDDFRVMLLRAAVMDARTTQSALDIRPTRS